MHDNDVMTLFGSHVTHFQHEYDHMLGKLFTEYAGNFQLRNAKRKQKFHN